MGRDHAKQASLKQTGLREEGSSHTAGADETIVHQDDVVVEKDLGEARVVFATGARETRRSHMVARESHDSLDLPE